MASRSARNNNPGNIRVSGWTKRRTGYLRGDRKDSKSGMAVFASPLDGLSAIFQLFQARSYRDLTLGQAITRYAPASENDTQSYIDYVSNKACVSAAKKLTEMDPFELLRVVGFMIRKEGWTK